MCKNIYCEHLYVSTEIKTTEKIQKLYISANALHQKSCQKAFKKISKYENYQNIMEFITESTYDEKTRMLHFGISHLLLPYDMILNFKIDRIKGDGTYYFEFTQGFLRGLTGVIKVEKFHDKKFSCFVNVEVKWKGTETVIPDAVFELFSQTVMELGIKTLWRQSKHRF